MTTAWVKTKNLKKKQKINHFYFKTRPIPISQSRHKFSQLQSACPSVTFLNFELFSHYCSCPAIHNWIAVYPALFSLSLSFSPSLNLSFFLRRESPLLVRIKWLLRRALRFLFNEQLELPALTILENLGDEKGFSGKGKKTRNQSPLFLLLLFVCLYVGLPVCQLLSV